MKMLKPEIEFIEFDTKDIITTSGGGLTDDPSKNLFNDAPSNILTDDMDKSLTKDFNGLVWNFNF